MKKNVLLIVLPYLLSRGALASTKLRSFVSLPYGLLSLASYAKRNCAEPHAIEIFDCNLYGAGDYQKALAGKLAEFAPDIAGLSMMFDNSYPALSEITRLLRDYRSNLPIVMGGAATIPSYKAILEEQPDIDAVCFSEGEAPFAQLLDCDHPADELEKIPSFTTRNTLRQGHPPVKTLIENLDDVIDIDYDFLKVADYPMKEAFSPFVRAREGQKQFFVITTRGCPYKCAFCMRSEDNDRHMRYASVERVIGHVRKLVDDYGMNILTFYDDQLLFNRKRAKQLFKELAQFNLRIECPNGLSVSFIDEEMADLMRGAGMDTVNLAIESGSSYVLKKIIDKPVKLDKVKSIIDILNNRGFWTYGSFVIGFPGETDEHRDETLKFCIDVGLDWNGYCHAVPYRGTKLYNICVENGYINSNIGIGDFDSSNFFINTPQYSAACISKKIYLMNLEANFVNNHRMRQGDYAVAARAFEQVIGLYGNHAFAHYYRARALERINGGQAEAQVSMNRFNEIIRQDAQWKEYARHFHLVHDSEPLSTDEGAFCA